MLQSTLSISELPLSGCVYICDKAQRHTFLSLASSASSYLQLRTATMPVSACSVEEPFVLHILPCHLGLHTVVPQSVVTERWIPLAFPWRTVRNWPSNAGTFRDQQSPHMQDRCLLLVYMAPTDLETQRPCRFPAVEDRVAVAPPLVTLLVCS